jgi:signal peptidase I
MEEKNRKKIDLEKDEILDNGLTENVRQKNFLATVGMFFLELVKIAVLAGITIGLVRYFIFKPFYVEGESMEPNFQEKEYLIIDEITYRFKEPTRGEVVVLRSPTVERDFYLKRIIGLPGERVKVENNKVVIYNNENSSGILVEESYLNQATPGSVTFTLGADEYFVMGDNRKASYDSRRFGPISRDDIIGRAWFRGWPIDRITLFEAPDYNF